MDKNDFKYVIQDLSKVYIGARFSYQELMDRDDIPFKLRVIIGKSFLKEVSSDTTIANHIFYLEPDSLSGLVYKQLKAAFTLSVPKDGKYKSKTYSIEEILYQEELISIRDEIVVEEMIIKKIHLMAVNL